MPMVTRMIKERRIELDKALMEETRYACTREEKW
jgi:hypothetical protein